MPKNDKQVTVRFNLNMIVVGLLTVLVFVSVVQTIALTNLIGKKSPASGTAVTKSGSTSSLPAALKDVPQQVGGC